MRLLVAALLLALQHRRSAADGKAGTAAPAAARPHIVLALIDDWGHSDVGFTNRTATSPFILDHLWGHPGSLPPHTRRV